MEGVEEDRRKRGPHLCPILVTGVSFRRESHSLVSSVTRHSPQLTTTPALDTIQPPLYSIASLSPASFQSTPAYYCAPRTSLTATATEVYPAFVSQQTHLCKCSTRTSLLRIRHWLLHSSQKLGNNCTRDQARSIPTKSRVNKVRWGCDNYANEKASRWRS